MGTFSDQVSVQMLWYGIGVTIALVMFRTNARQVVEHSGGEETIFKGKSPFRYASIIIIGTWIPFPMWYFLSPEGLGVVTENIELQLGWAFLNVTAKGTFV